MSLIEQLKWSLRHSKQQFLESLLVILAITLGVGVIITVLSLLLSVNQQLGTIEQQEVFRTLQIMSKVETSRSSGVPLVLVGSEEEATKTWNANLRQLQEFQRNLPPTMHAYVAMSWMPQTSLLIEKKATDEEESNDLFLPWMEPNQFYMMGTTLEYFAFKGLTPKSGQLFLPEDIEKGNRVMILTDALAKNLFGDENPVGKMVPIDISQGEGEMSFYTVIGVLNPTESLDTYLDFMNSRQAYIPVTASPQGNLFGENELLFSSIFVGVDAESDLILVQERVEGEARLIWGDQIAVRSPLAEFRESQKQIQRYTLLIGILASMGLIIAVINILNLMLARVLKRTKSIGISMALGSSRGQVFRQFMVEALSLGIIGAVLGIFLSFGLALVMQKALGTPSLGDTTGTQIVLGIVIGFAISLFFGIYPAYLGSKVHPVDALRTD